MTINGVQERIVEVINTIKESNAVLFIDEIHSIISSGSSEGSLDIANILKDIDPTGNNTYLGFSRYSELIDQPPVSGTRSPHG